MNSISRTAKPNALCEICGSSAHICGKRMSLPQSPSPTPSARSAVHLRKSAGKEKVSHNRQAQRPLRDLRFIRAYLREKNESPTIAKPNALCEICGSSAKICGKRKSLPQSPSPTPSARSAVHLRISAGKTILCKIYANNPCKIRAKHPAPKSPLPLHLTRPHFNLARQSSWIHFEQIHYQFTDIFRLNFPGI